MPEKTEYEYFIVKPLPLLPGRKTRDYEILNKSSGDFLGSVKWYGQWRQFCFFARLNVETVFSAACLADIQNFLGRLDDERKDRQPLDVPIAVKPKSLPIKISSEVADALKGPPYGRRAPIEPSEGKGEEE